MKLRDLQSLFQSAVLQEGESREAVLGAIAGNPRGAAREAIFGVYADAYLIRLGEFLDEDFPALRAYLGDEDFERLAKEYISAHPSKSPNARWFSSDLPEFLQEVEAWRGDARALGVAILERALTDAFDAPDAPALAIETLASFAPDDWPRLVFAFHPSLHLLRVAAGVLGVYESATAEEDLPMPPPASGEETLAVWRRETEVSLRELEHDEYLALNEARAGKSFGDICQLVAFQDATQPAPERLAGFLVSWFSDGLVTAVTAVDG